MSNQRYSPKFKDQAVRQVLKCLAFYLQAHGGGILMR